MRKITGVLRTIRGRLALGAFFVFVLVASLGGWMFINVIEDRLIVGIAANDLRELEAISETIAGPNLLTDVELPRSEDGTSFAVLKGSVVIADTDLDSGQLANPDVSQVSLVINDSGNPRTLFATSSLLPVRAAIEELVRLLMITVPLLGVGAAIITYWATGRALSPVGGITTTVQNISNADLSARVPVSPQKDEIQHLAVTMNGMLGRLEKAQTQSRQFISDASHELRSPITASVAQLELALEQSDGWPETAEIVLGEQHRLAGLVDDLLILARLDEGQSSLSVEVDLDEAIIATIRRHPTANIDTTRVAAVRLQSDSKLIQRLVVNLIDNAVRHASSAVAVSLELVNGEAVLVVEDDGPGVAPEEREQIFDRFSRLDDGRPRTDGGAGLGLALVKAVAEAHDGSATVSDSSLGGARFEVRLKV